MDDLEGAKFVAAVYGITWIAVVAYLGLIARKLTRLERRLDDERHE